MKKVNFGTDGWRGIMSEDFTVQRVREVVQAITSYAKNESGPDKMVIGYDNRFMSEFYGKAVAEVVCGNGMKALLSPVPVTSPMVSHAVNASGAAGGIMVTASHNPYQYNGLKFKAPYGGSASPEVMAVIEPRIGCGTVKSIPFDAARGSGGVVTSDYFVPYRKSLYGLLDTENIRAGAPRAAMDCMHGSAGRYAADIWEGLGLKLDILNDARDPYFGGINPEPLEKNLSGLAGVVSGFGLDIGLAADGDADRLGVLDDTGAYIDPHRVFALLLIHMHKNRGLKGSVVKTVSTSSLIDRIADDLGLPVHETPVGFKHICRLMIEDDVLIGGEENGGYGIKGNIPERDGILAGLLLIEMMAVEGRGIRELIADVEKRYSRLYHKRHDEKVEGPGLAGLTDRIEAGLKAVYGDIGIKAVKKTDGIKAVLKDGSWVLFRQSGTEPLLRIYAEASSQEKVDLLIDRGREAFIG